MPRKTYTAVSGDTLQNLSRQFYGVPNKTEDIVNANQFLQFRRDSGNTSLDGTPNIFAGDIITILSPASFTAVDPLTVQPDTLTLFMNGNETLLPDGSEAQINFDTCCNTFSSVFPFDPDKDLDRATWNPLQGPELDLYIGSRQIFGGQVETMNPDPTPNARSMGTSARTHTRLFEKSVCPSMGYPVEREGESLLQICEWLASYFSLRIDPIDSPANPFKKASLDNSTKCWAFVSQLATTRRRVMNATDDGWGFRILSPLSGESVARFEEGVDGFEPPRFAFNTAELSNTYLATIETPEAPDQLIGYRDPSFPEQSYDFLSLKDAIAGDAQDALEYEARKRYRDFFTTEISPGQGILNPKGNVWNPGDLVTLKAPSSLIYEDFDFLIRYVKYTFGTRHQRVKLGIIPPAVYLGEPISKFPWG
jgi:hypothetical protein